MPSVRVEPEKLSQLDEGQRDELVEVLNQFAACFSDKPGFCDVVTYRIVTTPEFVPKQMRPYRVPIAFRAEVNRQIRDLLDIELIRPSVSPMASPIACVAKKSGGMRIACDYRYLNSFTVGDTYRMSTINETLSKIGSSKIISKIRRRSSPRLTPRAATGRYQWRKRTGG